MAQDTECWVLVGKLLFEERERRLWSWADVTRHGGPSAATIKLHERGEVRNIACLHRHLDAFGLEIEEVLQVVLTGFFAWLQPPLWHLIRNYAEASAEDKEHIQLFVREAARSQQGRTRVRKQSR